MHVGATGIGDVACACFECRLVAPAWLHRLAGTCNCDAASVLGTLMQAARAVVTTMAVTAAVDTSAMAVVVVLYL